MKRPDISIPSARLRRTLIAVGAASMLLTVSSCSSSETSTTEPVAAAETTAQSTVISELIDGTRARQLVEQGAIVIDVRTPAEFAEGHVPDALLIDVSAPTFAAQIGQLDPDQAYVVYCRSGNRSAAAIGQMLDAGFTELYDLGPLTAWAEAGNPVVTG